ncbi:hypothetical protein D088_790049 [Salmonella enterica subsp. houtenae serovar 16:z4,z32:-- str. RKS3027]|nr:hypothetical protein D088_790049 [Salmonella enterica subsp. houtenae serovar 16:z4,z32:-- str. RKS3027]
MEGLLLLLQNSKQAIDVKRNKNCLYFYSAQLSNFSDKNKK